MSELSAPEWDAAHDAIYSRLASAQTPEEAEAIHHDYQTLIQMLGRTAT